MPFMIRLVLVGDYIIFHSLHRPWLPSELYSFVPPAEVHMNENYGGMHTMLSLS